MQGFGRAKYSCELGGIYTTIYNKKAFLFVRNVRKAKLAGVK